MSFKKWNVGRPDKETAKMLAEECGIDPFTALIACTRGIDNPSDLEQLLSDEPILCDPRELPDIEKAADFINAAIAEDVLIAVFGDYDCDGVVSTAIMLDYLSAREARAVPYIPDRESEGYGMNKGAVDRLHGMGVGLIVTVDNGIACAEEIAYAASLGISTVVTDHHLPPEALPKQAVAVVDPHLKGSAVSFKEICGAEVAFKLICVMEDREPEEMLHFFSDFLAVALIADVMPLVNENRSIVKEGLRKLKITPRKGFEALMSVAGIEREALNVGRVAFGIAPRINAAGRMKNASVALELLMSVDMMEALRLANELDEANNERRDSEKQIFEEACAQIENRRLFHNRVIVVAGENWHQGTVGIAASRITEKYGRPSIVLSVKDGEAHGSGRSIKGFHLYKALLSCEDCLTRFGGHELAAGVSLKTDRISEFSEKINRYAATLPFAAPELCLDLKINPAAMSVDMALSLRDLEPYGFGNPAPILGIFEATLEKINPIGSGKHLKLLFSKNGNVFQTLLFGVTPEQFCYCCGDVLDLAVAIDADIFRNEMQLTVQIKALRMSGIDDERLFEEIVCFDDYITGAGGDAQMLFPTREQTGVIYKEILKSPVSGERIKQLFLKEIGFAKTQTALTVLSELGLIKQENGILSADRGAPKTDLMCSETYKKLYEGVNMK